jgi:hypothetical protein
MLEITAHAPTRAAAIAFLQAVNIATVTPDRTINHPERWTYLVPDDDPEAEPGDMLQEVAYALADVPANAADVVYSPAYDEVIPGGAIVPIAEVQITGLDGEWSVEGVSGVHWNMRFYGTSEATLRKPEPQGGWLPEHDLFDRTYINELVAGRTGLIPAWKASAEDPVPPGYEAGQCRAFDPAIISTRANVWA